MTEANISGRDAADTNDDLAVAIRARTASREHLQAAQAALARATRVTRESAAEVERHAGAKRATEQVHATAVESWIAGGCVGDRPVRIEDSTLAAADDRARAEHDVTVRARSSLQAAQERAQAAFDKTENHVLAAVTAILQGDATRIAAEIVELERRAVELRLDLIGIIDHPLVMKKHAHGLPSEIQRGLYAPKPTPNSGFPLPRYADELLTAELPRVRLARQRWIERADELLNEPAETEASGRACA